MTFSILFCFGSIYSVNVARKIAVTINYLPNHPQNVFYWLSPSFAIIESGNLLLQWGGIVSCVAGIIIPENIKMNNNIDILKKILLLFIYTTFFSIISICSTYIYELVYIKSNFNLDHKEIYSFMMFISMLFYLYFWALIGYGLKLTFANKFICIVIGVFIQLHDMFFLIKYRPELEIYSITALSHQIIVDRFRFWDSNSWAYNIYAYPFASSSLIVDKNYNTINASETYVVLLLLWYLSLVYIYPTVKCIIQRKDDCYY